MLDDVGGFMVVAHPFRHWFDPVYFRKQGKEPFTMTPEQAAERMPVFQLVDAIEALNGANTPRENLFALRVAKVLGKPVTGGSDAHSTSGIGFYCTVLRAGARDAGGDAARAARRALPRAPRAAAGQAHVLHRRQPRRGGARPRDVARRVDSRRARLPRHARGRIRRARVTPPHAA